MKDIWSEKTEVRFGCVDRSDRLTLGSIFSFFQEAAISHAADLGVGRDVMAEMHQAWVLCRLSVFVERRPSYGEAIEIKSWPRNWEKLMAYRDYEIRDANDVPVVRGRGSWLVLDMEKRRPLRAQPFMSAMPLNDGIDAFPSGPAVLASRENLAKVMERNALYSDIDFYGHANNARYIQWIQDATDIDILTGAEQYRLDINYLNEVMPSETVELWNALIETAIPHENRNDYPASPGKNFAYEGRRPGSSNLNQQIVFRAELQTG